MKKSVAALAWTVIGIVVLPVAGPVLVRLLNALIPVLIIATIAVAALRLVWFYTNRW